MEWSPARHGQEGQAQQAQRVAAWVEPGESVCVTGYSIFRLAADGIVEKGASGVVKVQERSQVQDGVRGEEQ